MLGWLVGVKGVAEGWRDGYDEEGGNWKLENVSDDGTTSIVLPLSWTDEIGPPYF